MMLGKHVTYMKKTETRSPPLSCTKSQLQMIKDLNVSPKTLQLLQKKIGETLDYIDLCNHFLNRTPIAQEIRTRTDKLKVATHQKK
jgi:hypothetical protein